MKVIIGVIITALLVSGIWAFIMFQRTKSITAKFEGEISQLTATLDALGPNVDCYTVTEEYYNHYDQNTAGQVIQNNGLQVISVPSSLVGDSYIQDPSQIVGKYFKINVQPGTPITKDLVMAEKYDDTLRDVDITVNSWVVGMREGDFVDVNLTLPWGQDYIVLPHKRVMGINDKTIKMYLTEAEWHIYQSACVDWYLHEGDGARLYFKKYIEPGVQKPATPYYTVTAEVSSTIMQDPNITSRAFAQLTGTTRPAIDTQWANLRTDQDTIQTDVGLLNGGRSSYTADVNSDVNIDLRNQDNNSSDDTYEVEDVEIYLDGKPSDTVEESVSDSDFESDTPAETQPAETLPAETVGETVGETEAEVETVGETDDDVVG